MTNKIVKKLLCGTVFTSAALASAMPAVAQEDDSDVIIVTGSRLNQANIAASSPVQTIDSEIFDIRGATDVIDLINTLPSAFAAQTTAFANGANGTSTINLRGLGATRTLTLVNGKRLPFGSPTAGGFASDVNLVPSQLVERVEVVTGGASAVYGSDAIAGVVNFTLKKDFEGFEVDGLFGFNQHNNDSQIFQDALIATDQTPVDGSVTDNATFNISAIWGANVGDGRGNVTSYFSYLQNDGALQGNRDFAQCASFSTGPDSLVCAGSGAGPFPTVFVTTAEQQTLDVFDANGNAVQVTNPATGMLEQLTTQVPVALLNPDGSPLTPFGDQVTVNDPFFDAENAPAGAVADSFSVFDALGNPILTPGQVSGSFPLQADGSVTNGGANPFNFNPFNPVRRAVERFNAGFSGYYEIAENVEIYGDFGFTQSNSPQIIAPSAAFNAAVNQVGCDNPLLTPELLAAVCGVQDADGNFSRDLDNDGFAQVQVRRRFVEGGGRTDDRTLTNFRVVGGFRGTIQDNFEWDVFGQFANTSLNRLQTNQVTLTQLEQSLDIVADEDGNPVCRSALDGSVPDCLPFVSAFDPSLTSDPGLPAFVDTPTLTQGAIQQTVFGATISGDLSEYGLKSPFAAEGVSALLGVEYRRDQLQTQADGTNQAGLLVGAGGPILPTNGATEVYEFFLETSIPLISDLPFVEQLNISGAYRRSEYSSNDILNGISGGNFGTNTFSAGISWVPIEDLRIRGQFQRAIRAPNVGELFLPTNTNLTTLTDPCSGTPEQMAERGDTATAAQCANTGLPTNLFGLVTQDSGQLNTQIGGNANLTPESSDTFTVGAVYQPSQVEGLTISVDYFDIDVEDIVGSIPAAQILGDCLSTGNPAFCDLITRNPDGTLTNDGSFIEANSQNIASRATSGIDAQIAYSYDTGAWGSLNWNYNSTYLFSDETTSFVGADTFDCVGFFSNACANPSFDYRHVLTTTYETPWNIRGSLIWRYFSNVDQAVDLVDGVFTSADPETTFAAELGSVSYLDLALFWDATENATLRFGVNNVLDRDPPIVPTFDTTVNNEANTIAGVFDAGGRFIFVGANIRF